jgi:SAM-dependent methyltransferase
MARTILDRLFPRRKHLAGLRFDRLHGVETAGMVSREGLTGMSAELRQHAGEYNPTDPALFRRIMKKAAVDTRDFTFVDLGCGKGRIVLAAAAYPFKAIIGVEADALLYKAAQRNLERSRQDETGRLVRVVHSDARTFALPEGNLFVFLYSPFRGPVFRKVAERLAAAAGDPQRAVLIAYSSDWETDALERTGRFIRVRMRRLQFWSASSVSFFYNEKAYRLRRFGLRRFWPVSSLALANFPLFLFGR